MVLVDTSVGVEHFRHGDATLADLLARGRLAVHPFVIGEIACGSLSHRTEIPEPLKQLPSAVIAKDDEVLVFIDHHALFGKGIGYVDAHLRASAALSHQGSIWTLDKRLRASADSLKLTAGRAH